MKPFDWCISYCWESYWYAPNYLGPISCMIDHLLIASFLPIHGQSYLNESIRFSMRNAICSKDCNRMVLVFHVAVNHAISNTWYFNRVSVISCYSDLNCQPAHTHWDNSGTEFWQHQNNGGQRYDKTGPTSGIVEQPWSNIVPMCECWLGSYKPTLNI